MPLLNTHSGPVLPLDVIDAMPAATEEQRGKRAMARAAALRAQMVAEAARKRAETDPFGPLDDIRQ